MGGLIMAANYQHILFTDLSKEPTLRCDYNYIQVENIVSKEEYYLFDELFEIISDDNVNTEELGIFQYAEIGDVTSSEDVDPVTLDMDVQNELNANYFKKIKKGDIIRVQKNDILVSKVRPYLKKIILINDSNQQIYYTSSFIHLRPRTCPEILFYLLKGHFINYLNSISRQGKGYPTLSDKDLHYMKFCKKDIDSLLSKEKVILPIILHLENEIAELKKKRIPEFEIINEELGGYFNWDYETFSKQKKIKRFNTYFSSLSNNYDLRISAKFHRPSAGYVYNEIERNDSLRIKNYLEEPISLGASVSPSDFDDLGDCYYISMATVKNYKVELDDSQLLCDEYVKKPKNSKKKVRKGDIIMTRSGAAIGKFAYIENDINAIHADFTMKIRLKDINRHFAYYYFRSIYFQYLVEINYKGLQNNNIFPNQVQEFPIPNIPFDKQLEIVNKITTRINKQIKYNEKINLLRHQIDEKIRVHIGTDPNV